MSPYTFRRPQTLKTPRGKKKIISPAKLKEKNISYIRESDSFLVLKSVPGQALLFEMQHALSPGSSRTVHSMPAQVSESALSAAFFR
jgi:hypothetical protein